jgi:hypothetical protein
MRNTDADKKVKNSILQFLEQLKENAVTVEDDESVSEEIIEEVTEVAEEVIPEAPEPVPVSVEVPIPNNIQQTDVSSYISSKYSTPSKNNEQVFRPIVPPTPIIEKKIEKKIVEKKAVNTEIKPLKPVSVIMEALKENNKKLDDLSSKVDLTSKCKFKFDIRRDSDGFISSVIVEKLKD